MRRLVRGDRLVVASHNPGKVWEINQLLSPFGLDAVSAGDLGLAEPEETEPTFEGNAKLKAVAAAAGAGLPALADDSGLEIDELDGAPGIYSARWAGPARDFGIAMQRVHDALAAKNAWPPEDVIQGGYYGTPPEGLGRYRYVGRTRANFISVLCLAWPDGDAQMYEGKVFGRVVWPSRGGNGFGFDPMFVADGETKTFGEMQPAEKYAISHRTRAFAAFKAACLDHIARAGSAPINGRDLEALSAAAASLSTKLEAAQFIERLRADLMANGAEWRATTLDDYLAALQSHLSDPVNSNDPAPRAIAKALLAASRQ